MRKVQIRADDPGNGLLPDLVLRWRAAADEVLEDLQALADRKQIWDELNEIIDRNRVTTDPRDFYDWITVNYVSTQAIGIRRHAMTSDSQVTLAGLLDAIASDAAVFDYSVFSSIWDMHGLAVDPDPVRQRFEEQRRESSYLDWAPDLDSPLDPERVRADSSRLLDAVQPLVAFANNWVAHLQVKRRGLALPTFADLAEGLEAVEETYIKYRALLTGDGYVGLAPTRQYDWRTCLREAWYPIGEGGRQSG